MELPDLSRLSLNGTTGGPVPQTLKRQAGAAKQEEFRERLLREGRAAVLAKKRQQRLQTVPWARKAAAAQAQKEEMSKLESSAGEAAWQDFDWDLLLQAAWNEYTSRRKRVPTTMGNDDTKAARQQQSVSMAETDPGVGRRKDGWWYFLPDTGAACVAIIGDTLCASQG